MQPFIARDQSGNEIKSVGVYHPEAVSKNSYVSLETVQSLYLSLRWTEPPPVSRAHTPNPSIEVTQEEQEEKEERRKLGFTYIPTPTNYTPVRFVPMKERKRIVVTGGAGFVGSHLLMLSGHEVVVIDNFFSGRRSAVSHWVGHPNFELRRHDVVNEFMVECDQIYHLACPASPRAYQANGIKTMKTNFMGTLNTLGLAKRCKARFLLASSSEVYGSPLEHPQRETYWGNVNPIGPRACYDEGKRVAETLAYGYARQDGVDIRVARIFNTFGPRMTESDGRMVTNFIQRLLAQPTPQPIEIYGDGTYTRSLCYIHDLVDGLIELMNCEKPEAAQLPVNLGNPQEKTVEEWADLLTAAAARAIPNFPIHLASKIHVEEAVDDPPKRKPDTSRARELLSWQAKWSVESGLEETVRYFWSRRNEL